MPEANFFGGTALACPNVPSIRVGAALGFGGGCGLTPTLNLTSKLNLWVLLRSAVAALPSSQRSREVINERQEDQG